ncbi:MAG: hypothetical protein M3P18_00500 [Actinomycetota bacterium]|nr:hypothetical protein [Actinomycetota bacterium]
MIGRIFSRKSLVTSGLALGAVFVGVAFAAWTVTGSGSGSAKSIGGSSSTITTDATAAVADLYPGYTAGTVYFKVDNPNPYPVRFTAMTAGAVTSSDQTNCPASNVTAADKTGLTIDVPANTTTAVSRTVTNAVSMSSAAPDGCKSQTFTIGMTLSGTQQ